MAQVTRMYSPIALARIESAFHTIAKHRTSDFTGVCAVCGRAGPCDGPEVRKAMDVLAGYGLRAPDR